MQHSWIWLTLVAALLQAVRTAGQKRLSERMSTLAATYVRSLLGLPLMLAYLVIVGTGQGEATAAGAGETWPGIGFLGYCVVAAVTQSVGTAALLSLYRMRSFAVANQLTRTNLVFTAVLGALFFSETISGVGWLAIGLTLAGALALSKPHGAGEDAPGSIALVDMPAIRTGLFVGLMFGLCNLMIREATLTLASGDALQRGGLTVATVTALQVLLLGLWLAAREPGFLAGIWRHRALSAFVGVTSALGSICWFAAFAMTNASYVMAVGQVEAVFAVLISTLYFRERLRGIEVAGMVVVVAGVLLFRLGG
jgi:drug/metabolite transporter (DMT)-like permease